MSATDDFTRHLREHVPGSVRGCRFCDGERGPTIMHLIEASSLGTPGARALRARAPKHIVSRVVRRVREVRP